MTRCPICWKTPFDTEVTHAGLPEKERTNVQDIITVGPVLIMARSAAKLFDPWAMVMAPNRQPVPGAGGMDINTGVADDAVGELVGIRPGVDVAEDDVVADDRMFSAGD